MDTPPQTQTRRLAFTGLGAVLLALAFPRGGWAQTDAWAGNGPTGGKVYCITADPAHPATLYAGTARGIFKSDDGAATWRAVGVGLPSVRVQTIAIDPTATGTLYAGTITPNGVASVGIFKSTDAGETWSAANDGLIDPVTGIAPLDVAALAIDPRDPATLLAGTRFSEIFRSPDGGTTWEPETLGGFNVGLQTTSFLYSAANPAVVDAASTLGLLQSTDGGVTWAEFGNAPAAFFTLAGDPSSASTLYAGDSTGSGIWKSTDGGSHWSTRNQGLPVISGAPSGQQAPLILAIAVDPQNPSTIYAGSYGNGLFVSADAAASWSASNGGLRSAYVNALRLGAGPAPALYAGTLGGGVAQSADGARTWVPRNDGLNLGLVYEVVPDPSAPGSLFAAAFDGVSRSVDGGASWQAANAGLPVDPVDALLRTPNGSGTLFAATLGGGLFKSADAGASWSALSGLSEPFVASIAADPSGATLYAGTADPNLSSQRVLTSGDGGTTWTQTSLNAGPSSVDFLTVNPAAVSQVIAGSQGATGYFQSTDGGKTWSTITANTACGGINGALFSASGATLYLAGTTGVCRSADSGKTWTAAAVPGSFAVASLAQDPADPSVLYAGAALNIGTNASAVFRSSDGGQTWQSLGAGSFPNATVTAVAVDAAGRVYAGTFGAGVRRLVVAATRPPIELPPSGTRRVRPISPR